MNPATPPPPPSGCTGTYTGANPYTLAHPGGARELCPYHFAQDTGAARGDYLAGRMVPGGAVVPDGAGYHFEPGVGEPAVAVVPFPRDVTVVIPTIAPRARMLGRAIASVTGQTVPASAIAVAVDTEGDGAWTTRNRAALTVATTWTAFLDDDDELLPQHLEYLLALAEQHDAGIAWGWFQVVGGTDPFPMHRGRQFDPDTPHIVPITYLIRTDVLFAAMLATGGFLPDTAGRWEDQDMPLFVAAARLTKTVASDVITWNWYHHRTNTSGLPARWHTTPAGSA